MRMYPQTRCVKGGRGIAAFGMHYWSAELGGIERVDRDGNSIPYTFHYDPTDISRISLFRNGTWVGDGRARELQQADGTYLRVSLAEWKLAKHMVEAKDDKAEGKAPEELALVTDLKTLGKLRSQEKKAAQRASSKSTPAKNEFQYENGKQAPPSNIDEETQRVLRFLHQ